ncbi:MAG TPA: methyltransferase domain-containing protein [Solirubrobacteraceae bacterium]|nr:methyltransferase domain-containing protein [Solirubrobacteraceae bacterium]
MTETSFARRYGAVFDTVAAEYDRHRPTYPDQLIDLVCQAGGLAMGDRVLEIGCGTGQLTRSLAARGLSVTAVEPGQNLISLAGRVAPGVRFVNRRFEDAELPEPFAAVFCAAAFHWLDPDMSWRKVAESLAPGGLLALIQHCGVRDPETAGDADALLAVLAGAAPEIAAEWPALRDLDTILAGVSDRRANVSEVWAWVGGQPVARSYAAGLFADADIAVVPSLVEQTADELNALFRTTSPYHRMSPAQRRALEQGNREIGQRLGRPIRSSMLTVLVTARRVSRLASPA